MEFWFPDFAHFLEGRRAELACGREIIVDDGLVEKGKPLFHNGLVFRGRARQGGRFDQDLAFQVQDIHVEELVDLLDSQKCRVDVAGLGGHVARRSQQHVATGQVVFDFSGFGEEFPGKPSLFGRSLGGGVFLAIDLFGNFGRLGHAAASGTGFFRERRRRRTRHAGRPPARRGSSDLGQHGTDWERRRMGEPIKVFFKGN